MGRTRSNQWEKRNTYRILVSEAEVKRHLRKLGVDEGQY
jgi:hypothetical protein